MDLEGERWAKNLLPRLLLPELAGVSHARMPPCDLQRGPFASM